jgi:HSP20 family protein
MAKDGRSFFERLTGTVNVDDYDEREEETSEERHIKPTHPRGEPATEEKQDWLEDESSEGQLTVDVYNTPDEIVVRAIVAGVRPDDLDISITRDMVTIRGKREEHKEVTDEDYFYRELYWGTFSRTILLPQEIEVEDAAASEKHGLLTIRLPKIDKEKQTKLKVKSG